MPRRAPPDVARTAGAPAVAFGGLESLWFQLTGTLCNLACTHCFNASGPRDPWLEGLDTEEVRRYLREAAALGVKEVYFTGGEPFLHPDILPLLADALAIAPATVLTNGILIDDAIAERLADIAAAALYSLEVRVSLDAPTATANDRIRGRGAFRQALDAIRRLDGRGLHPIVTATEIAAPLQGPSRYNRLRELLLSEGIARPRIKILPLLPIGRCASLGSDRRVAAEDLDGFDPARLQCTSARAVAAGGVYACPILAGLPGARLATGRLADALGPTPLYHPACSTCYETGITCRNF